MVRTASISSRLRSRSERPRIAPLLRDEERPVHEIVEHFDISFQGVSQHLRLLADAGLVDRRKAGRHRYYRTRATALKEIYDWVSRHRRFWEVSLDRLADYLDDGS